MTLVDQDIVCFAGEDWWFHNPHAKLHLMKAWSARNRILFVNSPGIRMPDFKTTFKTRPRASTRPFRKSWTESQGIPVDRDTGSAKVALRIFESVRFNPAVLSNTSGDWTTTL